MLEEMATRLEEIQAYRAEHDGIQLVLEFDYTYEPPKMKLGSVITNPPKNYETRPHVRLGWDTHLARLKSFEKPEDMVTVLATIRTGEYSNDLMTYGNIHYLDVMSWIEDYLGEGAAQGAIEGAIEGFMY